MTVIPAPTTRHSQLRLGRALGAGGEAEVFAVEGSRQVAFKRYRAAGPQVAAARLAKLRVMIAHPPAEASPAAGHVAIAWPTQVVVDEGGRLDGFLMPAVDASRTLPVFQVYNPQSRLTAAPGFTWRYLLRTARNVAAIVDALHRAGYVVGDLNESNLLVNRRALVTLVDCDSMQVTDPETATTYRCPVGKPEFLAPEFHGTALAGTDRTPAGDAFALGILVFLLLMEGVHPFAGVWNGRGDPPDVSTRIRRGLTPHRRLRVPLLSPAPVSPPPMALPLSTLPPGVRRLVRRTFGVGRRWPGLRPRASDWVAALDRVDRQLRSCPRSTEHVYGRHLRRCPWCDRFDAGLPDPFPGPVGSTALERRPRRRRPILAVRRAAAGAARRLWARTQSWRARVLSETPVFLLAAAAAAFSLVAVVTVVAVPLVFALGSVGGSSRLRQMGRLPAALARAYSAWVRPATTVVGVISVITLSATVVLGVDGAIAARTASAAVCVGLIRLAPSRVQEWTETRATLAARLRARSRDTTAAALVAVVLGALGAAALGPWFPLST